MKRSVERVMQVRVKDNIKLQSIICNCGCVRWNCIRRVKNDILEYHYTCIQCGHKDIE